MPEPEKPAETLGQRLKRLSQSPATGGDRFVKGTGLGPISVHSASSSEKVPEPELSREQLKSLTLDFLDLLAKTPPPSEE